MNLSPGPISVSSQDRQRQFPRTRHRILPVIRLLVTGGTFDKEYDEIGGTLFFKDTHVQEMLRLGRSRLDVLVETVMLIDSLQMTAVDRMRVAERCRDCAESQIVITHGTDTIVETAAV